MAEVVHEIRLAGPWECRAGEANEWNRVQLPHQRASLNAAETLRRKFHRPSGLTKSSILMLAISTNAALAQVKVNGTVVPQHEQPADSSAALFDVTAAMQDFNMLEIELPAEDKEPLDTITEVKLQILES